jgi:hypothetical protein
MDKRAETSPRLLARIAGFFYLIIIATGMFAELGVRGRVIVSGDPAATAQNILANEGLYRLGLVSELVTILSAALVLTLLYGLLRPAGVGLARLTLIVNTVAIAGELASMLYHYAPLVYLHAAYANVNPEEMQALSYAALRMQSAGYDLSLTFFAVFCVAAGCLIFKSGYLPRWIGLLMVVAGLCYAANSITGFLAPAVRAGMLPWILLPCLIAEASLALWLLIVGVNAEKWKQRAALSYA